MNWWQSKQTRTKIQQILLKPEQQRDSQQSHILSLAFKKHIAVLSTCEDYIAGALTKYIQKLQLCQADTIKIQSITWIFVIEGSLDYHGMKYTQGENLYVLDGGNCWSLDVRNGSKYVVLTTQGRNQANLSTKQQIISQLKNYIKGVLFSQPISYKNYEEFWGRSTQHSLKKGQKINMQSINDTIYIIIQGSLSLTYQPHNNNNNNNNNHNNMNSNSSIKVKILGQGSIFSTFLGRYFSKTAEQHKNMRQYQYQYQYTAIENTLCLSFSADIFYENQKLVKHKYIVTHAWNCYLTRVSETQNIIAASRRVKPDKKEVIRNINADIQKKYLLQRCVSVPVAIQRRKLRKITNQIFGQKTKSRKIQNIVHSARTIQISKTEQVIQHPPKTHRTNSTLDVRDNNEKAVVRSNSQGKSLKINADNFNKPYESMRKSYRRKMRTEAQEENKAKYDVNTTFYRFFRPDEFISKKLKNHYKTVLENLQTFKFQLKQTPFQAQQKKQARTKRQQFQQYVNERRIVKLGPKKRLLYKTRPGF